MSPSPPLHPAAAQRGSSDVNGSSTATPLRETSATFRVTRVRFSTSAIAAQQTVDDRQRVPGVDPRLEALGRALDELSETDREVVLLVAWERMPHAQVAEVLGMATSTVAVRLHRARERLGRTYVKEIGDGGHQRVERDDPGDDQ